MTGDKVSTGDNARTELQLDFANTLRLGPNSKANVANLTHKNIQIQLGEGIATYIVSKDSESEPEIDTPNVSVHPSHHDGVFRVEVRPDGDTIVIVRQGEAQIATPQGSTEVRSGEMATVRGDSQFRAVQNLVRSRSRRLGPLEQRSRSHDPRREFLASHQPPLHRHAGSRRLRPLAERSRLRRCVGSERTRWLGSLSRRQLDLRALLRLDLGWL